MSSILTGDTLGGLATEWRPDSGGGVAEWSIATVSKTVSGLPEREFESRPHRHHRDG